MATYSKVILSGSTQGRQIKTVATSTPGTTIHTTGTSSTIIDEVWLYAYNDHTADVLLTIEYGSTTSPDDLIRQTITTRAGQFLIVAGLPMTGTGAAGNTIRAFAATANVIMISGYVNRITP